MLSVQDLHAIILSTVKGIPGADYREINRAICRQGEEEISVDIPALIERMVDEKVLFELHWRIGGDQLFHSAYFEKGDLDSFQRYLSDLPKDSETKIRH